MTREERKVLDELVELGRDDRGRRLLQLALRGIQESGRGLTFGCWVKRDGDVSGCLFQHAYWQGVEEGVFQPAGDVKAGIKEYVGAEDFALVMDAIRAFDLLGKRRFVRWRWNGGLALPRRALDEQAWRNTVERLLIDALSVWPEDALVPARPKLPVLTA